MPAIISEIAGMARSFYEESFQVPNFGYLFFKIFLNAYPAPQFFAYSSWRQNNREGMNVKVLTRRA